MSNLNKTIKAAQEIMRLLDIDTQEVSLVNQPANKRKFLSVKDQNVMEILKKFMAANKGDIATRKELIASWVEKADEEQLVEILKTLLQGLSDETLAKLGLERLNEEDASEEVSEDEEGAKDEEAVEDEGAKDEEGTKSGDDKIQELIDTVGSLVELMSSTKAEGTPEDKQETSKGISQASRASETDFTEETKKNSNEFHGGPLFD